MTEEGMWLCQRLVIVVVVFFFGLGFSVPMASPTANYPLPPLPKTVTLFRQFPFGITGLFKDGDMLYLTASGTSVEKVMAINVAYYNKSSDYDAYVSLTPTTDFYQDLVEISGTFYVLDGSSANTASLVLSADINRNVDYVCGTMSTASSTDCSKPAFNALHSIMAASDGSLYVTDAKNNRIAQIKFDPINGWNIMNIRADGNVYDGICRDMTKATTSYFSASITNSVIYQFPNNSTLPGRPVATSASNSLPSCSFVNMYNSTNDTLFFVDGKNERILRYFLPGSAAQGDTVYALVKAGSDMHNYDLTKYTGKGNYTAGTVVPSGSSPMTLVSSKSITLLTYGFDARIWYIEITSAGASLKFIWDPDLCPVTFPPSTTTTDCHALSNLTGVATALNCPNPVFTDLYTGSLCSVFNVTRMWYHYETGKSYNQTITTNYTPYTVTFSTPISTECHLINQSIESNEPSIKAPCSSNFYYNTSRTMVSRCPGNYTLTITHSVGDDCSSQSSNQVFNVVDTSFPSAQFPADISLTCEMYSTGANTGSPMMVTDNCDPAPSVVSSDVIMTGTCPVSRVIERTWTITDFCGNVMTYIQTINITDSDPPVVLQTPKDITLPCTADTSPSITGYPIVDDCSNVTINYTDVKKQNSLCSYNYIIERTWLITDGCNTVTKIQRITVADTTAPVLSIPASVTLDCSEDDSVHALGNASATDNCDPSPVLTWKDGIRGTCSFRFQRTWTVVDSCGNSALKVQQITFIATEAPVFDSDTPIPKEVKLGPCVQEVPSGILPTLTGQINKTMVIAVCGRITAINFYDDISNLRGVDGCIIGDVIRTWSVMDECKNYVTYQQKITLYSLPNSAHGHKVLFPILLFALVLAILV